jgi:hypothetical protein
MKNSSHQKPPPDDPKQAAAFRKAARELGADESYERFKETLRTLAKAKPAAPQKKRKATSV